MHSVIQEPACASRLAATDLMISVYQPSPRHVTSVNNERDAESIFAVSVTLVLTLRQVKKPL